MLPNRPLSGLINSILTAMEFDFIVRAIYIFSDVQVPGDVLLFVSFSSREYLTVIQVILFQVFIHFLIR